MLTLNMPLRPRGGLDVQLCSFLNLYARRGGLVSATPRRVSPGKDSVAIV